MAARTSATRDGVTAVGGFRGRLTQHPWRAFLWVLALQAVCYSLVGFVLFGILRLPLDLSHIEAVPTVTLFTVSGILAYLVVPFLLRLPNGSRTVRAYLDDIRLTRVRPFLPLLLLTLSCDLILILCQGTGSVVYRMSEGNPVSLRFLGQVFDLSAALPPKSTLLFAQMFSSLEEVFFRGVLLTMLLRRHSRRGAIVYSAAAFGLMHLPGMFAGAPVVVVLAQAAWAFLFGLAYGYIFVRTGCLFPSMILHWLSNVFQAPLTEYWTTASVPVRAFYGIVFGYGLAALLIILWVRLFAARWLPPRETGGQAVPATAPGA
jgi:membrane protease YdiL (CAAX protease family)